MLMPLESANSDNMDFEYVLAYALIESGREIDGMARMEKAAGATNSVDAWVIAGSARLHRREFEATRKDLDTAMKLNPDFPGLATLAGQARDAMGDTEAAQAAFEAALRQNPKDFMANLYLGTMHVKKREFEQARPLMEQALQLQPEMAQARFQMAKLNAMTGKEAEAAKTLKSWKKLIRTGSIRMSSSRGCTTGCIAWRMGGASAALCSSLTQSSSRRVRREPNSASVHFFGTASVTFTTRSALTFSSF